MNQQALALVTAAVEAYGQASEAGIHSPVYRVLRHSLWTHLWGIGATQCRDMLRDHFSRRMLTQDEMDALNIAFAAFEVLRTEARQPMATWSTSRGCWEQANTDSPLSMMTRRVGAYILHDPAGAFSR